MPNTYTYTARDAENPDRIITFTLVDDMLRVNLTGLVEQVGSVVLAEEKVSEAASQVKSQLAPATMKLVEYFSGPIHVNDLSVELNEARLVVTAWKRAAGLRLAPVVLIMNQVDNQDAAQAFAKQVSKRQEAAEDIGVLAGPLDYWLGWLGLALAIFVLLRWPRREHSG
ncbi:MAG: hypothetical protein JW862_06650 [Anaerolineales bacterium]|nr:hypothetical protein [Anaerolineales bacterium]